MTKLSLLQDQYLENSLRLKRREGNGAAFQEGDVAIHTERIQVFCIASVFFLKLLMALGNVFCLQLLGMMKIWSV